MWVHPVTGFWMVTAYGRPGSPEYMVVWAVLPNSSAQTQALERCEEQIGPLTSVAWTSGLVMSSGGGAGRPSSCRLEAYAPCASQCACSSVHPHADTGVSIRSVVHMHQQVGSLRCSQRGKGREGKGRHPLTVD